MNAAFVADDARLSWGRVVRARHRIARPRFADELAPAFAEATANGAKALAVGLSRSYGDSNLNPDGALIDVSGIDRIIAFDPATGVLRIEAGASLSSVLRFAVPRGWFLATVPGTRFVTVGGAIANDVHGKNHESAGSFGCSVRRLGLLRSDQGLIEISPDTSADLFAATIGGLGLTGIIAWAELQLVRIPSAYLDQEVVRFDNLDGYFRLAEESHVRFEHTVSWVDCTGQGERLGCGLFTRANWAANAPLDPHVEAVKLNVPVDGVRAAFNPLSLKVFNACYRTMQTLQTTSRVHYAQNFFPLDGVGAWNRVYGADGFYQYQCVVPHTAAPAAMAELLSTIGGSGSMLAVLKSFGPKRSPGLLSFPMPGVTLAMDFPNAGQRTLALFERLDAIVRAANGRLYPAKDGRMPAAMFQAGYPEWRRFAEATDPALSSAFWRRVSA